MWFVSNYGNIYGDEYLSNIYNVHNLLHLANDVRTFSSLNNFSCFNYKNRMQKLKKKLYQSGKSLEELYNRVCEEIRIPIWTIPIWPYNIVQYPITVNTNENEISHIHFKSFKILKNKMDNIALLHTMMWFLFQIHFTIMTFYSFVHNIINKKSLVTVPCTISVLQKNLGYV